MWARCRFPHCFFLLLSAGLASSASGCRNCDLVEAELRTKEIDVREMRADLDRAECHIEALTRELQTVRQGTSSAISPEQASQSYGLKQLILGRGTGGLDQDACPGDEGLQLVLEPRDPDGHSIKAPGSLHVEAIEISTEGLKTNLSTWEVSPAELRRTWRSSLVSSGYFVFLSWKNWPSMEKVRVVARLTLSDGRVFEADKDVTIRLTPAARQTPLPLTVTEPQHPTPASRDSHRMPYSAPAVSWSRGGNDAHLPQTPSWRAKELAPLIHAVQLARPVPLVHHPGENPHP